ncbi:MAG: hypothetical protein ACREBD_09240 [Blastocatellia bacterium]
MQLNDQVWYYTTINSMVYGPVSMAEILNLVNSGRFQLQTLVGLSADMSKMIPLITLIKAAAQQHSHIQERSPRGKTLMELAQEAHPYVDEVIWWAQRIGSFVATMRMILQRK